MSLARLSILICFIWSAPDANAQVDTAIESLRQIPLKYIKEADKKIDKYNSRITSKTEKTLTKLSKWENKIKTLLEKASPETAQRLFADNQLTFTAALEKYKKGEAIVAAQKARYDEYSDKLTTNLKYLDTQKDKLDEKFVQPVKNARQKATELEKQETNTEATEQFIKQRKKQLIDESIKYLGNSKYLTKINKESYYYIETLKNYKQIFNDKQKAEETALKILNQIPAFKKFVSQNSMLARLFGSSSGGQVVNSPGLQTRASVNALVQNQIAMGGPNAQQELQQNIETAQSQLNSLKDKILKSGGNSSDVDIPNFKPDQTKSRTFKQRLEIGTNVQLVKTNNLLPATADLGLSIGYKLNSKSVVGLGASYKMGMGTIQHISITHQGVGLRSFIDWKLKKQFFVTGGYEMNYNAAFKNIQQLRDYNDWQNSGLVGLSKKINVKTKWTKETKFQLLYDMLYREHIPISQPIIFRVGYNF